ncbi:MAG TPA: hypothetical protein PLA41_00755 [Candidatus Pacearchaeota archaeon]|nr:hypothetical protein [Candidatus Parcubacteria bacterium]HOU45666.1 hypothetical protein [Candidatus Pacearchaeota archaeon]HPM08272.1 hypothetical protein [Candidatus Pacearchaeota archaeon]HQI74595.1 hypothetical protein [Candidatus Pacearchaeota archaeon]
MATKIEVNFACFIDWNLLQAIKQHSPIARRALGEINDFDLVKYEILSQRSEIILYGIFSSKQAKRRLDEATSICRVAIEDILKAYTYKNVCVDISLKRNQEIDGDGRGFYQISVLIKKTKRNWFDHEQVLKISNVLDKNLKFFNNLKID